MKTVRAAIATIAACAAAGALVGGSLGFAVAKFVPGYYRTVFRADRDPNFQTCGVASRSPSTSNGIADRSRRSQMTLRMAALRIASDSDRSVGEDFAVWARTLVKERLVKLIKDAESR